MQTEEETCLNAACQEISVKLCHVPEDPNKFKFLQFSPAWVSCFPPVCWIHHYRASLSCAISFHHNSCSNSHNNNSNINNNYISVIRTFSHFIMSHSRAQPHQHQEWIPVEKVRSMEDLAYVHVKEEEERQRRIAEEGLVDEVGHCYCLCSNR